MPKSPSQADIQVLDEKGQQLDGLQTFYFFKLKLERCFEK
jgi:hypothetical protein